MFCYLSSLTISWSGKLFSSACCISNRRLFDDGTASEDGDVSLSEVVVVLLFFAKNCISIDFLFDVINQCIHLDVRGLLILTFDRFYPTSDMVFNRTVWRKLYILNEKRLVTSTLKYLFLVLVFINCKFLIASKAFKHHLLYIKPAFIWRWSGFLRLRCFSYSGCCRFRCSL